MSVEFEGLSKNGKKIIKILESVAEQGFVEDVNVSLTKIGLGKVKIPKIDKLNLLATAYEKQAELRYKRPLPDSSHFIPTSELENIGDRAIATELRRRISEQKQNSTV
jgi:hypothetical protein